MIDLEVYSTVQKVQPRRGPKSVCLPTPSSSDTAVIIDLPIYAYTHPPNTQHAFLVPQALGRVYWGRSAERGGLAPWTRSSRCLTHHHASTRQRDCGLGCKEEPRETCGHVPRGPKLLSPPFTVRNLFKDRDCPCVICYVMCLSYWDSSVFFTFSIWVHTDEWSWRPA